MRLKDPSPAQDFPSFAAMPIYEYYSPDTNKIYSFFAKTLAQAERLPPCPDDPQARMVKLLSPFAIGSNAKSREAESGPVPPAPPGLDDAQLDAAMNAMEREFANVDENDPRAMARMMRRMAELSGQKLDDAMEEAVRKLEEGADPESVESELGDMFGGDAEDQPGTPEASGPGAETAGPPARFKPRRQAAPIRDPKLYDYE